MSKLSSKSSVVKQQALDVRIELIQALIPVALDAVADVLEQSVIGLAGLRYSRKSGDLRRWGRQAGSVYLGDQKVPISVPRVRDVKAGSEVTFRITSYNVCYTKLLRSRGPPPGSGVTRTKPSSTRSVCGDRAWR